MPWRHQFSMVASDASTPGRLNLYNERDRSVR